MARVVRPVAFAASVALGFAACGSDAGSSAQPPEESPGDVTVVAEDLRFPEDTYRAMAGAITVSYRNEGSIEHTPLIEGVNGFMLDVPANGDVDEAAVELDAGEYTMYCDVPGHRQAGMEATLEVA